MNKITIVVFGMAIAIALSSCSTVTPKNPQAQANAVDGEVPVPKTLWLKTGMRYGKANAQLMECGAMNWTTACSYVIGYGFYAGEEDRSIYARDRQCYDLPNGMLLGIHGSSRRKMIPGTEEFNNADSRQFILDYISICNSRMLRGHKMEMAYSFQQVRQWGGNRTRLDCSHQQKTFVYKGMSAEDAAVLLSGRQATQLPLDRGELEKVIGLLNIERKTGGFSVPDTIASSPEWRRYSLDNRIELFVRFGRTSMDDDRAVTAIFCTFPVTILVSPYAKDLYDICIFRGSTEFAVLEYQLINIAKPVLNRWQGHELGYISKPKVESEDEADLGNSNT
ncbi:MAG: hypothetical protein HN350_00315 [Phycisphaerales bacterium]|nr:hypothetical protein [Phycisphaerales bacterium]